MQLGQSQSWPAAGQDTGPAPLLHSLDIGNYHLHIYTIYSGILSKNWLCQGL